MVRGIFSDLSAEWWEAACFELCWHQHGGSGLGRTYQDLLAMPVDMIQRDLQRQDRRRSAEADAMRSR
jgi:hypothetical protein